MKERMRAMTDKTHNCQELREKRGMRQMRAEREIRD